MQHGVTLVGHTNLPAQIPAHASQMYAKNLTTFLDHLIDEGRLVIDREDEISVNPQGSVFVSIEEQLGRDLRSRDVYKGMVALEITGDAPFGEEAFLVHATQYFGKRKRPKGAAIHRPLFLTNDP